MVLHYTRSFKPFAMSSSHNTCSYRPSLELLNSPFLQKPSGRHWSTDELQWLHVDFTSGLSFFNNVQSSELGLLGVESRLAPDCALVDFFRESFGRPWNDIIQDDNLRGHYLALHDLGTGRQKRLSTVLSSSPQGPPSSQVSLSSQIPPTASHPQPPSISSSASRTQSSPWPPPATSLSASKTQSSPPILPGAHHQPSMSPTPSHFSGVHSLNHTLQTPTSARNTAQNISAPIKPESTPTEQTPTNTIEEPIQPSIQNTPKTPVTPSRVIDRLISPTIISTVASDSTYKFETPSRRVVTTEEDITEDMPEHDVVYAARTSLYIIRDAFSQVTNLLKTQVDVSSAEMMTLAVEASMCTTTPDLELCIIPDHDDERAVSIFTEVRGFSNCPIHSSSSL